MGKERRVAKMLLGALFIRTFDSHCSFCYNDCIKSLGGRYNGKAITDERTGLRYELVGDYHLIAGDDEPEEQHTKSSD